MSGAPENAKSTTGTTTRLKDVSQLSGMCPICGWSHFQIMMDVLGAKGIELDPDKAIFPAVDITTSVGGIPLPRGSHKVLFTAPRIPGVKKKLKLL